MHRGDIVAATKGIRKVATLDEAVEMVYKLLTKYLKDLKEDK